VDIAEFVLSRDQADMVGNAGLWKGLVDRLAQYTLQAEYARNAMTMRDTRMRLDQGEDAPIEREAQ